MTWTNERFFELITAYAAPEDTLDSKGRKARRILIAAIDKFLQFGFRKASIGDIARAAGVGKGTVYLYFDTKADLLMHCILFEKARPSLRILAEMEALSSPREALRHAIHNTFDLVHELPLANRVSVGDHEIELALDELGVDFRELVSAGQVERITSMLKPLARVSDGRLDEIVRAALTLLRAGPTAVEHMHDLHLDRATHANAVADILCAGLLATVGAEDR